MKRSERWLSQQPQEGVRRDQSAEREVQRNSRGGRVISKDSMIASAIELSGPYCLDLFFFLTQWIHSQRILFDLGNLSLKKSKNKTMNVFVNILVKRMNQNKVLSSRTIGTKLRQFCVCLTDQFLLCMDYFFTINSIHRSSSLRRNSSFNAEQILTVI